MPTTSSPSVQPPTVKIEDTPTLPPAPTTRPTTRPSPYPTLRPAPTQIPQFPTDAVPGIGNALDACTLVRSDEIAVLFSNPPQPFSEATPESGYIVSKCAYDGGDWTLTISMAASPDFINSLARDLQTIRTYPLFERLNAYGAEIYQVGTTNESGPGDVFGGIILKDNTAVEIVGNGTSYVYQAELVTQLLSAIAHRLPPETAVFNACDLVRWEEVEARFPNPPSPESELFRYQGYSVADCSFRDDAMKLYLSVQKEPDSIPQYMQELENMMKEYPFIIHYTAYGTDIYQWGGSNLDTSDQEVLAAILIKGDNVLQIQGQGVSYQYDEDREREWMGIIASRLP